MFARRSYLDYLVKRLDDETFAFSFSDAQTKLVYDLTPRHHLEVLAVAGRSAFHEPPDRLSVNDEANARSDSAFGGLTWKYAPSSRFVLAQRFYATGSALTNTNRLDSLLDEGRAVDVGWRADATVAASAGRVVLDLGGAVQRTSERNQRQRTFDAAAAPTLLASYDERADAASAYAQTKLQAGSRFSVTPGIRVDRWRLTRTVTSSPWLIGEWAVTPATELKVGTGVYQQFPDLANVFGINGGGAGLRPERAIHVDAGIVRSLGRATTVRGTVYARRESHVLWMRDAEPRLAPDGSIQPGRGDARWSNALDGDAAGVEIVLRRNAPDRLSGWAGYAYGSLRYTDLLAGETFWADADQRHTVSLFGNYRISNRSTVNAKFRYGSNYPLRGYVAEQPLVPGAPSLLGGPVLFYGLAAERNTLRLPAYARLDIRADRVFNWSSHRITLFGEVINALNRTNLRNVPFSVDRRGRVSGATDSLMPIVPSVGCVVEF